MKSWAMLLALSTFAAPLAAESVWDKGTISLGRTVGITVHRSPTCGCCGKWIEHMQKQGFLVKDVKTTEMDAVKRRAGVPEALASCHTAEVDGYVIEGHVPAADVKTVLSTRAKISGLTAPGMPSGSPGMEMGGRKEKFAVIAFDKQGNAEKFSEYDRY